MILNSLVKIIALASLTIGLFSCATISGNEADGAGEVAAAHCPGVMKTNTYSIAGPALVHICCTANEAPNEVQEVFSGKETSALAAKTAQLGVAESASNFSCVRADSLTAVEKASLTVTSSCKTIVTHEPTTCSCFSSCDCSSNDVPEWTCNCPGFPANELPEVADVQDSLGSENLLVGNTETSCGGPPPSI